tara:strand:+ start:343 stop:1011 length:669 start_codon:yes stop_codon:yes gene_type:complete
MSNDFLKEFLAWMNDKSVFLVAGSDLEKVKEQVPESVLTGCKGIFCCMANQFWNSDGLVYENSWTPDPILVETLTGFQMYTSFPVKTKKGGRGSIIERRPGMINFTTIGRNASATERLKYYKWDKENGERKDIVRLLEREYKDLDFRIGGQISIDIQPKGFNKSQASKWVRKHLKGKIVYFGDKCEIGGNDHDIYHDVVKHKGIAYNVKSPRETLNILANEN